MSEDKREGKDSGNSGSSMSLLEASTKLVGSLAWPITILVLVISFQQELTTLLRGVTKVEYPGGSITVELDKIEAGISRSEPGKLKDFAAAEIAEASLIRSEGDPRIALTTVRHDLERELFRPSSIGLSPPVEASRTTSRRIDNLIEAGLLDHQTAEDVRAFLKIANDVIHAKGTYTAEQLGRAVLVGANLVSEVRHRIIGAELEHHFGNNLLWHHAYRTELFPSGMKSAVAAAAPEFEYDFDLYLKTIESFNAKEAARASKGNYEAIKLAPLSLAEFIEVLEFRESEIERVVKEQQKPNDQRQHNYHEWEWPEQWGEIGWTGPVIRGDESVASDLPKLRNALATYRRRSIGQ